MLNSELFGRACGHARGHVLYVYVYGDKSAFPRRVAGPQSETVNSHKFNYETRPKWKTRRTALSVG